jgi:hypothetical protein
MDQIIIDIEDNDNCGYFPMQVFEVQGEARSSAVITIPSVPGSDEPHDVAGWCSEAGEDGGPCDATAVAVGDSGAGQVIMIHGGDHGIRMRPASSRSPWSLSSADQIGEPYMLIASSSEIGFSD